MHSEVQIGLVASGVDAEHSGQSLPTRKVKAMYVHDQKEKRHHVRSHVSWSVLWRDSKGMPQQGCVCDVGKGCAFVRAFVGSHMDDLRGGASVNLVFVVGKAGQARSVPVIATVRWRGKHDAYRSSGLGVQFDDVKALSAMRSLENAPWLNL